MNKLLIAVSLASALAITACGQKETTPPPETGATTGQHLENAAAQAEQDIQNATQNAAAATATAVDNTANSIHQASQHAATATATAVDNTANAVNQASQNAVAAAKDATVATATAVEQSAQEIKEKAQQ